MTKHWYFISYEECVVCGYSKSYRERRYTEKPIDSNQRYSYKQFACGEHFI